ncbi:Hpt domain-containing protein [Roseivivax sp. CAU 1753]
MTEALDLSALRNLKQMIGGDPDDLSELIGDFVATLPVQVQQMRENGENGDLVALRIAAHSCKSNSRDLGALYLSQLCARLETECASGNVTNFPAQLSQISDAADTALSNLAALDISDV